VADGQSASRTKAVGMSQAAGLHGVGRPHTQDPPKAPQTSLPGHFFSVDFSVDLSVDFSVVRSAGFSVDFSISGLLGPQCLNIGRNLEESINLPMLNPCGRIDLARIEQWYHIRFACGRPWVQIPVCPFWCGRLCFHLSASFSVVFSLPQALFLLGGRGMAEKLESSGDGLLSSGLPPHAEDAFVILRFSFRAADGHTVSNAPDLF
jgi:hypothetical protein